MSLSLILFISPPTCTFHVTFTCTFHVTFTCSLLLSSYFHTYHFRHIQDLAIDDVVQETEQFKDIIDAAEESRAAQEEEGNIYEDIKDGLSLPSVCPPQWEDILAGVQDVTAIEQEGFTMTNLGKDYEPSKPGFLPTFQVDVTAGILAVAYNPLHSMYAFSISFHI